MSIINREKETIAPLVPPDYISDTLQSESPIGLTTSWLTANIFEGCSCNCIYCFRHRWCTASYPQQIISVKEAFELLISHEKFLPHYTPITVNVASTDSLLPEVIESTLSLIKMFEQNGYRNPFGVVSKIGPNGETIEFLCSLKNVRPVLIISYSGMPKRIEPVSAKNRINAIKQAKQRKLSVILMYKPIVQGWNDSTKTISKVFSTAGKYVDAIVFGGLRLDNQIAASIKKSGVSLPYPIPKKWGEKELPIETINKLYAIHNRVCPDVPIYRHTSCALSKILQISNYNMLYKVSRLDCTTCPQDQYHICNKEG